MHDLSFPRDFRWLVLHLQLLISCSVFHRFLFVSLCSCRRYVMGACFGSDALLNPSSVCLIRGYVASLVPLVVMLF